MTDVKCLAYQYLGSKRKKKEIDTQIKKLEQQLLDTEELGNLKLLLSNEGGQKTYQGITKKQPHTKLTTVLFKALPCRIQTTRQLSSCTARTQSS
mgnify:CR=1 FL=1